MPDWCVEALWSFGGLWGILDGPHRPRADRHHHHHPLAGPSASSAATHQPATPTRTAPGSFLTSLAGLADLRSLALKHLHTASESSLAAGLGALSQLTRLEVRAPPPPAMYRPPPPTPTEVDADCSPGPSSALPPRCGPRGPLRLPNARPSPWEGTQRRMHGMTLASGVSAFCAMRFRRGVEQHITPLEWAAGVGPSYPSVPTYPGATAAPPRPYPTCITGVWRPPAATAGQGRALHERQGAHVADGPQGAEGPVGPALRGGCVGALRRAGRAAPLVANGPGSADRPRTRPRRGCAHTPGIPASTVYAYWARQPAEQLHNQRPFPPISAPDLRASALSLRVAPGRPFSQYISRTLLFSVDA